MSLQFVGGNAGWWKGWRRRSNARRRLFRRCLCWVR